MPLISAQPVVLLLTYSALALLGFAALHDVMARTIPNWVSGTLAVAGLCALWQTQTGSGRLLAASLLFGGAALLWRCGWLGGGDAKLLGAIGLLLPPNRVADTVMMIAFAGALLALPYLVCRGRVPRPEPGRPRSLPARAWRAEQYRLRRGGPLPYGVAIAAGAALGLLGTGP